ncbi:Putative TFIID subunit TAF5, NTD2 domain, WD40/YVTN repeat-like-containing domain superfamily [Septoria linicola]|uniref:TFIID subunit TAF5, NTD2 domain, WD40/YVTN repeat-like-containing domain superfamily n=1 Tax=Septoria linicola TaxID=215465 RepID=A0A9Q9EQW6_9PEZI|nr:putative TFIID subunit TAF5, NTD2 domain, WD40/YVTN repeat-like-containing domain superfamily [Septoria linicola]USW59249.1 Putative TFIID subunit TAF5, NTD2 domain, WD40/YVTN repeat-like-containing domain superfamily [Septoria linicola]
MASQPLPPSRTTSVGPPSAGGMGAPPSTAPGGAAGQNQQQNLNQIVLEYLSKKGYSRTEAMLRKESANTDATGTPFATTFDEMGGKKYGRALDLTMNWIDNVLDIYKPELKRLLWPLFVYFYLNCIGEFYTRDAEEFFTRFRDHFEREHVEDVRNLSRLNEPEHAQENSTAQLYRDNRYRLTLSNMAFQTLMMHLESKENEGGKIVTHIISQNMDIRVVDRAAAGSERSLAKMLASRDGQEDVPAEDEGIPGHNPGSANLDPKAPAVLSKLSLGPLPMEDALMEDLKAELQEHDSSHPPGPGQNSMIDELEERIKVEPDDTVPTGIPFPPSTARDVLVEVNKVKENRDRFRIEGKTGGVGPGLSVTMFTFHNTFDSVNCIEFSGDNGLVAVGTAESYIRVWSLDNRTLTSATDPPSFQPSSSRRLIGHSGPVYALSFSPSVAMSEPQTNGHTNGSSASYSQPRYLVSGSADCTIRLWSLDTWTNLVVYKSHNSPVWDVRFSPYGHYFASASADRTARLWSTPQIAPLRLFVGHDSDVEAVAWHPNSAYIFTGSGAPDRTVRMWDIQRGQAVRIFTGHVGNVTALACSPSGKMVASADDRGEIILWDLARGRLVKRMRGHGRGGIWSLDWSVESSVLVSGGADGTVRVWDVQPNKDGQGKIVGEGGAGTKIDGAGVGGGAVNKGKSKKDVVVSPDQISAFPTKKSPVYKVGFTQMNLVVAGGAYLP